MNWQSQRSIKLVMKWTCQTQMADLLVIREKRKIQDLRKCWGRRGKQSKRLTELAHMNSQRRSTGKKL